MNPSSTQHLESLEAALETSRTEAAALRSAAQQGQELAEQLRGKVAQALKDKDQALRDAAEAKSELAALQHQCCKASEDCRTRESALRQELTAAAATATADFTKLKVSRDVWRLASTGYNRQCQT